MKHAHQESEVKMMAISRSENMRRIHGKDTKPEIVVRNLLRSLGFPGYRLHRKDLPGTPDIAYMSRRKAIIVNGCFWHGHDCKRGYRKPKTNQDYWISKIHRNQERDRINQSKLRSLDWQILVLWECELKDQNQLSVRLLTFLAPKKKSSQ